MEINASQLGLTSRSEDPSSYSGLLAKRPKLSKDVALIHDSENDDDDKSDSKAVEKMEVKMDQSIDGGQSSSFTKPPPLVKIQPTAPESSAGK